MHGRHIGLGKSHQQLIGLPFVSSGTAHEVCFVLYRLEGCIAVEQCSWQHLLGKIRAYVCLLLISITCLVLKDLPFKYTMVSMKCMDFL